jgi:cyclophilin family peptidyl-prolyl cis-trans isomerase
MPRFRTICFLGILTFLLFPTRAGTLVQFRTTFGDIEVELYDQDKPLTVQNFLRYVQSGRYTNEFSHRLMPYFVLQGGGYTLTTNTISAIPTYPPIINEYGVGNQYSNVYGTIAMAKLGSDTNSATSQWFFNLTNNPALDAHDTTNFFVVFGHVIAGTNVLNIFNHFQYWVYPWAIPPAGTTNLVLYQYYVPPFDNLPLLYPSPAAINYVFIDITLLQVAIQTNGSGNEQISWNSATGLTNIVEFTTNFPPVWNTLVTTNGTGARMTATDTAVEPMRFYRVRVIY